MYPLFIQFQQLSTHSQFVSFYFLLLSTPNYFEADPPVIFWGVSLKEEKIAFFFV